LTSIILTGDFNRHHPLWDEPRNEHLFTEARLSDAQVLIDLIATHDLHMALPPGIPTHELLTTKNYSRLDHVFVSGSLTQHVLKCTASPTNRIVATDHFPILTELELKCTQSPSYIGRNFKGTDWEEVWCALERKTTNLPTSIIRTVEELNSRVENLTSAITSAIEEAVPLFEITPYSKRWWNKKLKQLRTRSNNLRYRHARHRQNPIPGLEEEWREAENEYKKAMEKAKQTCWNEFIDQADGAGLWTAHKYLNSEISDGGATRVPTLTSTNQEGHSIQHAANDEKSRTFYNCFFPKPTVQQEENNEEDEDDIYPPALGIRCDLK